MKQLQQLLTIRTSGRGLVEITEAVRRIVEESAVHTGLCCAYVRHTSASLVIQENADPSAVHDLERFLLRLAPDGDPSYTHTEEGPDDMASHLRSAVTRSSETIPVHDGQLALGTWQGLFLCEHRLRAHTRQVLVHVQGE